jgi:hypothetical protein
LPCWQALRSLALCNVEQQNVQAAATVTQLTSLGITTTESLSMSCLGTLTALRSLCLSFVRLEVPGLFLVSQQCISLSKLRLLFDVGIRAPLPNTNQPQPPLPSCSWPALLELQLGSVQAGLVSHVLPTPAAAPLLACLAPWELWPDSWPRGLQCASISVGRQAVLEQLAADLRCLAACSVPCQALWLMVNAPQLEQAAQQAAAVAPLAPTLTHLSMSFFAPPTLLSEQLEALCMALPQLRSLHLKCESQPLPSVSKLLGLHPSLCQLLLSGPASAEWARQLLLDCDAASATAGPQGTLTVQLPQLQEAELAAARQLWAQLAARVATPASRVVVTDFDGRDLLAA